MIQCADQMPHVGISRRFSDPRCVWGVLHVQPQREAKVCESLAALGIDSYLPVWTRRRNGPRPKIKPVYPNYVFAVLELDGQLTDVRRRYVHDILRVRLKYDRFVADLQSLMTALTTDPESVVDHLTPGMRMRVVRGPLTGCEGVLIRRTIHGNSRDVLMIGVEMFARVVETQVDRDDCEPV